MEGRNQVMGMFTGYVLCQKLIKMVKFGQIEIFAMYEKPLKETALLHIFKMLHFLFIFF